RGVRALRADRRLPLPQIRGNRTRPVVEQEPHRTARRAPGDRDRPGCGDDRLRNPPQIGNDGWLAVPEIASRRPDEAGRIRPGPTGSECLNLYRSHFVARSRKRDNIMTRARKLSSLCEYLRIKACMI